MYTKRKKLPIDACNFGFFSLPAINNLSVWAKVPSAGVTRIDKRENKGALEFWPDGQSSGQETVWSWAKVAAACSIWEQRSIRWKICLRVRLHTDGRKNDLPEKTWLSVCRKSCPLLILHIFRNKHRNLNSKITTDETLRWWHRSVQVCSYNTKSEKCKSLLWRQQKLCKQQCKYSPWE